MDDTLLHIQEDPLYVCIVEMLHEIIELQNWREITLE